MEVYGELHYTDRSYATTTTLTMLGVGTGSSHATESQSGSYSSIAFINQSSFMLMTLFESLLLYCRTLQSLKCLDGILKFLYLSCNEILLALCHQVQHANFIQTFNTLIHR